MPTFTLAQLYAEIDAYLRDHPEHGNLPVLVPYDSKMALTTVYGGITKEGDDDGDPYILIDGDS